MRRSKTFTVKEAFDPAVRGKSTYTRAYIRAHQGVYPVYSAAADVVGHVDTYDIEGEYLTWSMNGYAGFLKVLSGRFSMTADRAALRSRFQDLNLEYAALVLQPAFRAAARGRTSEDGQSEYSKLRPALVQDLSFEVPVTEKGELDVEAQTDYVRQRHLDGAFLEHAASLARLIEDVILLPEPPEGLTVEFGLMDDSVFELVTSSTGWFKRDWLPLDTGDSADIPVYSAAPQPHAHVKVVSKKLIQASPTEKLVSFAVDGDSSAGTNLVLHDRPFYISNNRSALRVLRPDVLPEYVLLSLRSMKADHGFNFNFKAYRAHLQDVTVQFPALSDGGPDLERQKAAVAEVDRLEALQERTAELLLSLSGVTVGPAVLTE